MPENVALKFNIGYCQSVKREQNAILLFFLTFRLYTLRFNFVVALFQTLKHKRLTSILSGKSLFA